MKIEQIKKVEIKNLRFWNKNPRYSTNSKILIDDIGTSDFETEDDFILKDDYLINYKIYFNNLLNNLDSIKITLDLIESISTGFNTSLDDIFIVEPKMVFKYLNETDSFEYLKNISYVVEGNRRLLCLDLLKNFNNSRYQLSLLINSKETTSENINKNDKTALQYLRKILDVCNKYDKNPTIPSFIGVKELNYDYYITSEGVARLNKTLNSRHFGNRKGKLNWPRGLILRKIFQLTKSEIKKNPMIIEDKKIIYSLIEDYVGKKISSADINASLFVNKSIDLWNKKNPNDKISWSNTETGDIDQVNEIIVYDDDGIEVTSTEQSVGIFVSSLENSRSNIKLLDRDFNLSPLSKVVHFEFDYSLLPNDEEYIKAFIVDNKEYLSKEIVEKILIEITFAVKEKEINTRSFANIESSNVGSKIRSLIFPNEIIPTKKILTLNLSQISSLDKINLNSAEESKLINGISSNLREIFKNYNFSEKKFTDGLYKKENDLLSIVISYIWKTEYGRIVKFKDKLKLNDIPTLIFSLLYRTTYEFITQVIGTKLFIDDLNKKYKGTSKYEIFRESTADNINRTISDIFKNNGNNVNDFRQLFLNENIKNRLKMVKDFEKLFYILMGLDEFDLKDKDDIKFEYFDNTDEALSNLENNFYTLKHNSKAYFLTDKKIDLADLKLLRQECKNNNMFGLFKPDEDDKITAIFEIIELYTIEKNSNNISYFKVINRFIHKPLSALSTYNSNLKSLNQLNEILILFKDVEEKIIKIIN